MVKNWKDLNNKEKALLYREQREFCKDEIDDVDIIKALKQCGFVEDGDSFIISGFNKNLSEILSEKDVKEQLYETMNQIDTIIKNNYITPEQGLQYIDRLNRIIKSTSDRIDELIKAI